MQHTHKHTHPPRAGRWDRQLMLSVDCHSLIWLQSAPGGSSIMQGQNAAILGEKSTMESAFYCFSNEINTLCDSCLTASSTVWREMRCAAARSGVNQSLHWCAAVQRWTQKISLGLWLQCSQKKRAGTSNFGAGHIINRRGSSGPVPNLPLSLNPTFSIVCVCWSGCSSQSLDGHVNGRRVNARWRGMQWITVQRQRAVILQNWFIWL